MKNNKWNIIHECDGEDCEPACWAKEINHTRYGNYVWIRQQGDMESKPFDTIEVCEYKPVQIRRSETVGDTIDPSCQSYPDSETRRGEDYYNNLYEYRP